MFYNHIYFQPYYFLSWIIEKICWIFFHIGFQNFISYRSFAEAESGKILRYNLNVLKIKICFSGEHATINEELIKNVQKLGKTSKRKPKPYPCDLKKDIYILNQTIFIDNDRYPGEIISGFSRPYFVKRVAFSNLLLVAIKVTEYTHNNKIYSTPEKVIYSNNIQHPCQKLNLTNLPRRRLQGCFNEHSLVIFLPFHVH